MASEQPIEGDRSMAFLAEARLVIGALGGINPLSLARLRAIAQQHGLSASQMASLIRDLRELPPKCPTANPSSTKPKASANCNEKPGPTASGKPHRQSAASSDRDPNPLGTAFENHAAKIIGDAGVLWPPIIESLLINAKNSGLAEPVARQTIHSVSKKLGIPSVSPIEAEKRIVQKGRDLYLSGAFGLEDLVKLKAAAERMGIAQEKFKDLLERIPNEAGEPSPGAKNGRRWQWILICATLGTVFIVSAIAINVLLIHQFNSNIDDSEKQAIYKPPQSEAENGQTAAGFPGSESMNLPRPSWAAWGSDSLIRRLEVAQKHVPNSVRDFVKECGQLDAGRRKAAYANLRGVALPNPDQTQVPALLAHCFREETEESNVRAMMEGLDAIPRFDSTLVPSLDQLESWCASAALLAELRYEANSKPQWRDLVHSAFEKRFGEKTPLQRSREELINGVAKNNLVKIYEIFAEHGRLFAARGLDLCEGFRSRADALAGISFRLSLETKVAEALFESPTSTQNGPDVNGKAKRFFQDLASARNPDRDRLLRLLESSRQPPLRGSLETAVIAATGLSRTGDSLASAVRAAWSGMPANEKKKNRNGQLIAKSLALLGATLPPKGPLADQLEALLQLAHANAMACCLVGQAQPQDDRFDQLLEQPPKMKAVTALAALSTASAKKPPGSNGKRGGVGIGAQPNGQGNLAQQINPGDEGAMVRKLTRPASKERAIAFASLCRFGELATLDPDVADALVRYLLRPQMDKEEMAQLRIWVPKIAKSLPFKLALAERLLAARSNLPGIDLALDQILSASGIPTGPRWREAARHSILETIADDGTATDRNHIEDAGENYLRLLKDQGRALGLTEPDFLLMNESSSVLNTMARFIVTKLALDKLSKDDRRIVDSVPHFLAVAMHQKWNDLQSSAIQQRVLLKVLELWVRQRRPQRHAEAQRIVADLAAFDRNANLVVPRLVAGEAALLKTWILLALEP